MEDLITLSRDTSDRPDDLYLGMFIKKNSPSSYHLGFIYCKRPYSISDVRLRPALSIRDFNFSQATWTLSEKSSSHYLAHFGWKNMYLHGEDDRDYHAIHWLGFIDPENAYPIIKVLGLIKPNIDAGYGITYGESEFDELNGNFVKDPEVQGDSLTCAVFVLRILEQFGFYVVDRDSWIIDRDTEEWQNDVITKIQKHRPVAQPNFLQIQKDNVGKFPRFSPDQVLGASCIFEGDSIMHTQACEAGVIVLKKLEGLYAA